MRVGGVLVVLAVVIGVVVRLSVHHVTEGHVGIYYFGGRLLNYTAEPGVHFMWPFITRMEEVQVTVQTDQVLNIPCGTSGGVMIMFEKIEVVNYLDKGAVLQTIRNYTSDYDKTWIYDRIHHSVNQFCSLHTLQEVYIDLFDTIDDQLVADLQRDCNIWAPGLHIINCRVTKPKIPRSISDNFESMEAEKTRLMISQQRQRVVELEAETERRRQNIQAQMQKEVAQVELERDLRRREGEQKMAEISDQMHLSHEKALADAAEYKIKSQAEANKALLTPQFLLQQSIAALANNTKVYFGERIPSVFLDQQLAASDVSRLLDRVQATV